jgi:hypothetical protein
MFFAGACKFAIERAIAHSSPQTLPISSGLPTEMLPQPRSTSRQPRSRSPIQRPTSSSEQLEDSPEQSRAITRMWQTFKTGQ